MMIRPNKFTDLNNCLISIAAEILTFLKNRSVVKLSDLDSYFSKKYSIESDEYKYAFDFLYATGCIDYKDLTDEVILLK